MENKENLNEIINAIGRTAIAEINKNIDNYISPNTIKKTVFYYKRFDEITETYVNAYIEYKAKLNLKYYEKYQFFFDSIFLKKIELSSQRNNRVSWNHVDKINVLKREKFDKINSKRNEKHLKSKKEVLNKKNIKQSKNKIAKIELKQNKAIEYNFDQDNLKKYEWNKIPDLKIDRIYDEIVLKQKNNVIKRKNEEFAIDFNKRPILIVIDEKKKKKNS